MTVMWRDPGIQDDINNKPRYNWFSLNLEPDLETSQLRDDLDGETHTTRIPPLTPSGSL